MPGGVTTDVKTYSMLIDGEWVASKSAKTFPVYDPSTEEVIAQVPDANAEDVNRAVAAAKAAFESGPWATTTAQERGRVLFRLAEKVRQNLNMLAELECRNSGKPIVEAEFDINDVATCFEYYGGLATKVVGYVNPVPDNAMSLSLKEPMGVAGQIIPWNYPLMMAAWKLAPALAAGCTCVLKPAEQTPLTALELAKWFDDVGLPKGVVNVITGFGESCGSPLVKHPDVNKIAFTGSAAVGKIIVKEAADTVKRVTLELGGKSLTSFLPTLISRRPLMARCLAYSLIREKFARRAAGFWCRSRSIASLLKPWPRRRRRSRLVRLLSATRRWDHWYQRSNTIVFAHISK
jgi:betaine-aldehyde dehydrogenase